MSLYWALGGIMRGSLLPRCTVNAALLGLTLGAGVALAQGPTPVGRIVAVPGAKLYFEEAGSGPPLFLLHHFLDTGTSWRPYVRAFAQRFRVIVLDVRRHGRSTNSDTSTAWRHEQAARDLLALMDSLGVERASGMGSSSGAIALLYAASMYPQRFDAIAVIGAQMYLSDTARNWIGRRAWCIGDSTRMPAFRQMHGNDKGPRLARQFCHFKDLYGDIALTPDKLSRITARTLVIHGDSDWVPVSQAWDMYSAIPRSRLWIVPNGGHWPHADSTNVPDLTRRTMEFFLGKWR